MKCKFCGGEIRLEDLVCPYCGQPNEEAQRHAQDMRRYQYEFQKTKADVTEKAGNASKRAVRIAAIAFLIVAIGANIALQANSYSIRYSIERKRAVKNASELQQKLDEYLDSEDYIGFVSYSQMKRISMSEQAYDDYYPVYRIAMNYKYAVQQLMRLVNHRKYDSVDRQIKYTTEYVQEFYETLDPEQYSYYDSYSSDFIQKHIANMTESLEAMFTAYLDMTPEEAHSMSTLSRAGQAALIERGAVQYEEAETNE